MRESPKVQSWVVYETVSGSMLGTKSVCSADEWKVIEARELGRTRIVKEGIANENEAEKLARGTSGDPQSRPKALRPTFG